MEKLKRPPIDIGVTGFRLLIAIVLLALGGWLINIWGSQCTHFRDVRQNAVTLDAKVIRVEEHIDGDGGSDYSVYVSYEYNGKEYTSEYVRSIDSDWEKRVGQTVEITVNPNDPTEELDDIMEGPFFALFFGLPIFCLGIALLKSSISYSYVEHYGLNDSAIRCDIDHRVKSSGGWLAMLVLAFGLLYAGFYAVDIDGIYVMIVLFGILALSFAVIMTISHFKKRIHLQTDSYRLLYPVVKDKRVSYDHDADAEDKNVYEVLMDANMEQTWVRVKKSEYETICIGDQYVMVHSSCAMLSYVKHPTENFYRRA